MSDANAIAGAVVRVCKACGALRPIDTFAYRDSTKRARRYECNDCKKQRMRNRYAHNHKVREASRIAAAAARRRMLSSDSGRERWRQWKRNARRAKARREGRTFRDRNSALTFEQLQDRLTERNARDAWTYWLRVKATDDWIHAYYDASGEPWRNPRLSDADAYRIRYARDPVFYAREYARLQAKKVRQRAIFAEGSVSAEELLELRMTYDCCAYCGVFLTLRHRHIDHATPLARDGRHEIGNLVICCKSCNSKKGAKTAAEFSRAQRSDENESQVLPQDEPRGGQWRAVVRNFSGIQALHYE